MKKMDEGNGTELSLFGRPLMQSGRLSLSDQVYDILCQEIHAKRWDIGDQLPSISVMAEECGLSIMPVRQAVERLRNEGYLRAEKGSGTFLAARLPQGAPARGGIGICAVRHAGYDDQLDNVYTSLDMWRVHAIIEEGTRRNFTEQVRYIPRDYDYDRVDAVGGLFDEHIKGIISLQHFERDLTGPIPHCRIPLVFLSFEPFSKSSPCVALDLERGFYQLTRRVIMKGHREILCLSHAQEDQQFSDTVFGGYERAMEEAELPVCREAYEMSRRIIRGEWTALRECLEKFTAPFASTESNDSAATAATAIVCAHSHIAMDIVTLGDIVGFRVPKDLSVVAYSTPMRAREPERRFTGLDYNLQATVSECFDLLEKQIQTRRTDVSSVQVNPLVADGYSLLPPWDAGRGNQIETQLPGGEYPGEV